MTLCNLVFLSGPPFPFCKVQDGGGDDKKSSSAKSWAGSSHKFCDNVRIIAPQRQGEGAS